jgi:hypothetical protein
MSVASTVSNPLPHVVAPWAMEIGGWVVFVAVALFLAFRWKKNGQPSTSALLFIGCFSMFWQEFYADWGCYLYYNPELTLLPWGPTPLTTPNKPLYVVAGYGWFWAGFFPGMLGAFAWARRQWAEVHYLLVLFVTILIPFYFWNLFTADAVSFMTNWYQYLYTIGPAVHTSKGSLPFIYPAFPFVFFAPAVVASLDQRDSKGRTWFERMLRVPADVQTVGQRVRQVVSWIVGMNMLYSICLTIPLIVIRLLFLPDNPYVP